MYRILEEYDYLTSDEAVRKLFRSMNTFDKDGKYGKAMILSRKMEKGDWNNGILSERI